MSITSRINYVRKVIVGVWQICIALCLIIVTSPVFWLIDYDKLILFVKRYGIDVMVVLSILFGIWMHFSAYPVRGPMFAVFCILMSILQRPKDYFE